MNQFVWIDYYYFSDNCIYLQFILLITYNKRAAQNSQTSAAATALEINKHKCVFLWSVLREWSEQMVPEQYFCHLRCVAFSLLPLPLSAACVFCSNNKKKKKILWSLTFIPLSSPSLFSPLLHRSLSPFCMVVVAGCSPVSQHHLLQPAVREHQRHHGGRAPGGTSGGHPRRRPQDAPWLRHPGRGAGPQAVRCAAHCCCVTLFECRFPRGHQLQASKLPWRG